MDDTQISKIAKAEYYGDKKLSKQYDTALRRIKAMIREEKFEYKDEATRVKKGRQI